MGHCIGVMVLVGMTGDTRYEIWGMRLITSLRPVGTSGHRKYAPNIADFG